MRLKNSNRRLNGLNRLTASETGRYMTHLRHGSADLRLLKFPCYHHKHSSRRARSFSETIQLDNH